MIDLPPDPELNANQISYVYDKYDRVYIKNYYLGTVGRGRQKATPPGRNAGAKVQKSVFVGEKKPKKLLYQDVYRYKDYYTPDIFKIDRIYQPLISPIEITLNTGSRYPKRWEYRSFISCKSPILGSGFIYSDSNNSTTRKQTLLYRTLYPDWDIYNPNSAHIPTGTVLYIGTAGLGEILGSYTKGIVGPGTRMVKAFCAVETGVLFSPAITLS